MLLCPPPPSAAQPGTPQAGSLLPTSSRVGCGCWGSSWRSVPPRSESSASVPRDRAESAPRRRSCRINSCAASSRAGAKRTFRSRRDLARKLHVAAAMNVSRPFEPEPRGGRRGDPVGQRPSLHLQIRIRSTVVVTLPAAAACSRRPASRCARASARRRHRPDSPRLQGGVSSRERLLGPRTGRPGPNRLGLAVAGEPANANFVRARLPSGTSASLLPERGACAPLRLLAWASRRSFRSETRPTSH